MSSSVEDIISDSKFVNLNAFIVNVRLEHSESVKLQTCKFCGRTFVTYRRKGRPLEYCCDECRKYAREEQSRIKSYRWYHKHKHELSEKQRWGLGSGYLSANRNSDFDKESKIIKREMNRLRLRR